ncbi:General transcription factor IIE subunit 1 [Quillaja saponaria]|uniref:General transcription factor IIE subunit 1 n=1 Tax=Quillaja saponaria TaxID=32244 RepID=A0AAD7QC62_QUISA|nr:General transcription factor IIE subunit 1 [Quillaja saponaria]KAJ7978828.1 General transcription factor IIE subunit 1 [Quillaja saponaria]
MSMEPFNKLVKLAARAFYDDITKGDNQPKTGRSDNRGIAVVVLDALTRRQWVREEDFAKDLKLHTKQLRRTLRFFEEEKLVTRDHRRETAKGAKIYSAAVSATADQKHTKEGEEKVKLHTHSYCCLDYAQIYDVVRYRLHRMKKKLKDELENKNTIQEYTCANCRKRYNALDALRLVSMEDEDFHCESCNGVLEIESDKLAAQEGEGDDNARRRRREKLKDMLQKMEVQLKPLVEQLNRVKDLPVPEFGSLQAWEARASAAGRAANGDAGGLDPSKSSQGLGYGGTPMPFLGDTKVEVAFSGAEGKGEDTKSEIEGASQKVLPPWMIKQGMNLTKEQLGEVKQEAKMDGNSTSVEFSDDKKSTIENDDKTNLQDEYFKAYYAALLQKQQELEEAAKKQQEMSTMPVSDGPSTIASNRQVGMKSKRDDDEGDDDVEWEEAPVAGNANENYKVNDLNVEADASVEDDDDIDWEEG